jgi:arsenite methyltransferase
LDLGSGAGIDIFLSANKVGKNGNVIGIDMADEMLAGATMNAKDGGYSKGEFKKGDTVKRIPVGNYSVGEVISNCVINLKPTKSQGIQGGK